MKKAIMITAYIMVLSLGQGGICRADEVFVAQMDKAAGQLVAAWMANDRHGMSEAVNRLTRYELYNAAVDDCRGSYLCQIPLAVMNQGEAALAAYIFLIRKEREGVSLWPKVIIDLQQPPKNRRDHK